MNLKLQKALATAALLFTAAASASAETFEMVNESRLNVYHVYVSRSGDRFWGSDRLGSDVLFSNYRLTLNIPPGFYDVKLVDGDGDSCVLPNVDLRSSSRWTLTDQILIRCEALTALR